MKQLGSKDRAAISEMVYTYFRNKSLIEYLYGRHEAEAKADLVPYWTFAFDLIDEPARLQEHYSDKAIPAPIRLNLPSELYEALTRSWGDDVEALALSLYAQAPLTIRVNREKISTKNLADRLVSAGYEVAVDPIVDGAIHFAKRVAIAAIPEFQEGFFEIQDIGSQRVAAMVEIEPKQHFLDYCAGSGGKALAVHARMQGSGQMYLHDIRDSALLEAKKRLRRAGVQNAQWIFAHEKAKLSRLRGKVDWVLVDAPCSGTGTLRRNPDMKWKFSQEMVLRLQEEQKAILREAISFLKPGGRLVFATCSLLREENEDIVRFAQEELGLCLDTDGACKGAPMLKTAPHIEGCDGFFAVRLKRSLN